MRACAHHVHKYSFTFKGAVKWAATKKESTKALVRGVALFSFEGASETELNLNEGDIITIQGMSHMHTLYVWRNIYICTCEYVCGATYAYVNN